MTSMTAHIAVIGVLRVELTSLCLHDQAIIGQLHAGRQVAHRSAACGRSWQMCVKYARSAPSRADDVERFGRR